MTLFAQKTDDFLSDYQSYLLAMLKDISEICRKNNINWWLESGSLLGIIRHNDFIPWDDDIDIAMTRNDYNKFLNCVKSDSDFNEKYKLITEKEHYNVWGFAKVESNQFTIIEKVNGRYCQKMNAFIDIFPFDSTSTNVISRVANHYQRRFSYYENDLLKGYSPEIIFKHYMSILIIILIKNINKLNMLFSKNDGLVLMRTGYDVIHKKEDVFPIQKFMWRDVEVYLPCNPKKYLIKLFGKNYMQLPPVEKRVSHGDIVIK